MPKVTQRGQGCIQTSRLPTPGPTPACGALEPSKCRHSHPPNPHTRHQPPLPLGTQWPLPETRVLGRALRQGRTRLGQARSRWFLCSPRSEDALRQVPDNRDAPTTARFNLPTRLCTILYPESLIQRRSRWAAGRSRGRGEVRVTGRSPSGGHRVNRHSGRVHFKASRPERWRGRGGELDGSPQYLLGNGVRAQRT